MARNEIQREFLIKTEELRKSQKGVEMTASVSGRRFNIPSDDNYLDSGITKPHLLARDLSAMRAQGKIHAGRIQPER